VPRGKQTTIGVPLKCFRVNAVQVPPQGVEPLPTLGSLIGQRTVLGHKWPGHERLGHWRLPPSPLAPWPLELSPLVDWRSVAPKSDGSKSTSLLFGAFALLSNCGHRRIAIRRASRADCAGFAIVPQACGQLDADRRRRSAERLVGAGYLVSLGPTMAASVTLDVFGKRMLVEWVDGSWRTYLLGSDGKRSLVNIAIPESIPEAELVQYFDDIYHEAATPERPAVIRLS